MKAITLPSGEYLIVDVPEDAEDFILRHHKKTKITFIMFYPFSGIIPTVQDIEAEALYNIFKHCCERYGISVSSAMVTRCRNPVIARRIAMWVMRKKDIFTVQQIANFFGFDHATVCYATNKIADYPDEYNLAKDILKEL